MKAILLKCESADFVYISEVLENYASFTDDSKRKELTTRYEKNPTDKNKEELASLIDKQIKYFGSSDMAYLFRSIFNNGDAGVSTNELIDDVCGKLKVSIKQGGSIELKLERLVKAVVEKELLSKSPEELREAFRKFNIGEAKMEQILDFLKKNGRIAALPIILEVLGPTLTLSLVQAIIIGLITAIVGREAAKIITKEILKRNPFLNALGPVVWIISGAWLAFDLQGAAFRKTVPICLYLGIVALRDGPVNGDRFFSE